MGYDVVGGPYGEPLHRDEVRPYRRSGTADDSVLDRLIPAARIAVENHIRKPLVTRTVAVRLDCFPAVIRPEPRPLRKFLSIEYLDEAGVEQTLDASNYRVDATSKQPRITPAFGETWPTTYPVVNAITLSYVAGFATPFTADAGADTITAKGHPYAAGDLVRLSNSGGALPGGLTANTDYYAVNVTGDTLQLAASVGGNVIDITDAGAGLHFLGELPEEARMAMQLLVGHWYENREEVVTGTIATRLPAAANELLFPLVGW